MLRGLALSVPPADAGMNIEIRFEAAVSSIVRGSTETPEQLLHILKVAQGWQYAYSDGSRSRDAIGWLFCAVKAPYGCSSILCR